MLNIGKLKGGQRKKDLGNKIDFNNGNFQFYRASIFIENLTGNKLEYMKERIEHLQKVIPTAFDNKDTILYIF